MSISMTADKLINVNSHNFDSIAPILPYQPTASNWHPQATDTFFCHYHAHPAHEVPNHCGDFHTIPLWEFGSEALVEGRMDGKRMAPTNFGHGESGIIPAGVEHWGAWHSPINVTIMFINPQFLDRLAENRLNSQRVELIPQHQTGDLSLYHLGMAIKHDAIDGRSMGTLYTQSLATSFAVRLLKNHGTIAPKPLGGDLLPNQNLDRVIEYINDRLHEDLHLADLAKIGGYSQYYLCRLFKKSIGISIYQYVIAQRTQRAQELLHRRDLNLGDIAVRCGFANNTHLTKHFKRIVGITPKQARSLLWGGKDLSPTRT